MPTSNQKNKLILSLAILTASLGLHAMASVAAVLPAEFSKARQLQFTAETFQKYLPQLAKALQKVESLLVLASSNQQVERMEDQFRAAGGDLS